VRAANGAEVRGLCAFLRQRLVMEFARGDVVEAEVELIFSPKFEPRLAQRVVAVLRARMAASRPALKPSSPSAAAANPRP